MDKLMPNQYKEQSQERFSQVVSVGSGAPSVLSDYTGFPLSSICDYVIDGTELLTSFDPVSYNPSTGKLEIDAAEDLTAVIASMTTNIVFLVDSNKAYYQLTTGEINNTAVAPDNKYIYIPTNLKALSLATGACIIEETKIKPILTTALSSASVLKTSFIKNGGIVDVTEDTVTPANNIPLPVKLTGVDGDVVINATDLNLEVGIKGVYDVVTNPIPDSTAIVAHERTLAPDITNQIIRVTATTKTLQTSNPIDVNFVPPESSESFSVNTAGTNIDNAVTVTAGTTTADRTQAIIFNLTAAELSITAGAHNFLCPPGGSITLNIFIPSGTDIDLISLATTANLGFVYITLL